MRILKYIIGRSGTFFVTLPKFSDPVWRQIMTRMTGSSPINAALE